MLKIFVSKLEKGKTLLAGILTDGKWFRLCKRLNFWPDHALLVDRARGRWQIFRQPPSICICNENGMDGTVDPLSALIMKRLEEKKALLAVLNISYFLIAAILDTKNQLEKNNN